MKSETLALALILLSALSFGQVAVSPAPDVHPQFLDNSGNPLAGGKVFTYAAGTLTPLATYIDATGTITNPNPILLDASGSPSNGSVQTGIWLSNNAYKFCVYDLNLVQQYCVDNIVGYLNILNLSNLWTLPQTFTVPITVTALNNQLVFGSVGAQTTLDFPIPVGNVTIHAPSSSTTLVGRDTVDTLTNKTSTSEQLNSPFINGTQLINSPGTYITLTNASSVGTSINSLAKIANSSGQARVAETTDTGGIIGITVQNPGTTGIATIQQSGTVFCNFDNSATGGDYITISSITGGFCHDAGSTYPTAGQVIGRVVQGGGVPVTIDLFGPEIRGARTSPAIASAVAGAGAGTAPTITCGNCFDNGGRVVVTTGSTPGTNGTIVTITPGGSYTQFNCTFSPSSSSAAALTGASSVVGAAVTAPPSTFVLTSGGTALAATTQYIWQYTCTTI